MCRLPPRLRGFAVAAGAARCLLFDAAGVYPDDEDSAIVEVKSC